MNNSIGTDSGPRPWAIWLYTIVAFPFVGFWVYIALPRFFDISVAAAKLVSHFPDAVAAKAILVLAIVALHVLLLAAWVLSFPALHRGRSWGLVASLATVVFVIYWVLKLNCWQLSCGRLDLGNWVRLLLFWLILSLPLTTPKVRAYCSLPSWHPAKLALAGIGVGVIAGLAEDELLLAVNEIAAWMKT